LQVEQGILNNEGKAKVRTSDCPDLLITRKRRKEVGHEGTKA
jgi:hypothetical protein